MAISLSDCASTGSALAYEGKQHLDPKTSVATVLDLETLNDYLPPYSLVIVEQGEEAGHLYQLQTDGAWTDTNLGDIGATLDDENITDSSTYSSSKIDNTYRKKTDSYSKDEADAVFGTLTQQTTNTSNISTLQSIVDNLGNAVRVDGEVATHGDLLLLENVDNGSLYFVTHDESHEFAQTKYIYSNNGWIFSGYNEIIMRDFTSEPIDLSTEVTGKLDWEDINIGSFDASDISYEDNDEFETVAEALNSLLYKNLSITFSTTAARTLEQGNSVINPVFNWSYNKNIVSQSFDGTSVDIVSRTYTYNGTITANKTFVLRANDGTKDSSSSVVFSFLWATYCGSAVTPVTFDSTFILGLSQKKLQGSVKGDYTVNCADGEKIYFAFPEELCSSISWWVGGFQGGFAEIGTYTIENVYNVTHSYKVFVSDNSGLGSTTITVK